MQSDANSFTIILGLKTQLNCTKKELERMTSQMKSLEENLAKEKEQNKQLEEKIPPKKGKKIRRKNMGKSESVLNID